MKPEEKAFELVDKMYRKIKTDFCHNDYEYAVQCAIIVADELLNNFTIVHYADEIENDEVVCDYGYWEYVKLELEKML